MWPEWKIPSFLAWLGALAVLASLPVGAQAQSGGAGGLFTVSDVQIDQTAETASAARVVALREGQREAFARLLARLTTARDRADLPAVEPQTLESVVQALQIENEKTSSVRYLADLTVTFRAEAVRAYLRDHGIPYAETRSRPLLVLPVLQRAGGYVLWDDPNPWRAAWSRLPVRNGLVPMVVPVGDLADFSDVNAQEAVQGDREALSRIAGRYGTAEVLVAVAQVAPAGVEGVPGEVPEGTVLSVAATRVGGEELPPVISEFRAGPAETLDALMHRAADAVADAVEDAWKEANLIRFGETGTLRAAVAVSGLQDWIAVRDRLASVAVISRFRLIGLTRDSAEVEIVHLGDEAQLEAALAQKNLVLERKAAASPGTFFGGGSFFAQSAPAGEPTHILRLRQR